MGILPFYHIYGMVVIMLSGLKGGAQIITLPKFEQDSFVKTLDTEKVINYLIRIEHLVKIYVLINFICLVSKKGLKLY